ncbi:hypothetical protein SCHIN_v1c02560 [Spiroplasma chinense]|uniref:Transmembrane protein n=1 Tax=Spiroplasma chinense TaxID=216932 RepID=A0A5B9Y3W6_9MOLU|nr:hypothetical protein [Spiroplasma chinense]QEH61453.1 hypothetical protein SCHIN_v1c02560 [Spiroplasma chinense]
MNQVMRSKKVKLEVRTILLMLFLLVTILMTAKSSKLSESSEFENVVPLIIFILKNSFILISLIVFFILTIRVITLYFSKKDLNILKIEKSSTSTIRLFYIFAAILVVFKSLSTNFSITLDFTISKELYEKLYIFEISILTCCTIASIISIFLFKNISGDVLVFDQEILIEKFQLEIESLNKENFGFKIKFNVLMILFDNKIKQFISKTNKQIVVCILVRKTKELIEDKKAKMPPLSFF